MNDAIKSNDIAAVKRLLANGSVDVNARTGGVHNRPLVVLAADAGRAEIVTLLLDTGAKIDAVDDYGETACHAAVRKGHAAVLELLVARNANLSLRNGNGATPLHVAIDMKNEPMLMLLIDAAMASGTLLDDATTCRAAALSADVIRLLLFKHRINLGAIRDSAARTPLHQAVWHSSDASVFKILIEVAGVNIDARDQSGWSATHYACIQRDAGALARLVAAGANLDLASENGNTPLHYCLHESTNQIACLLLAAGANVNARNWQGRTPCHIACECALIALPALLASSASLDEPDNDGVTSQQLLKSAPPTTEEIEAARRHVLGVRLSLVRKRAFEVCIGLHSRGLDALCMCEILLHSCGPVAPLIAFHRWWTIATTIKHFRGSNIESRMTWCSLV